MNANQILKKIAHSLMVALLSAGLIGIAIGDDDDKLKIKEKDDKVKIKDKETDTKIKIKGEDAEETARAILAPEVKAQFVKGYAVPEEYRIHFRDIPLPEQDDLVVRYFNGNLYYLSDSTFEIQKVVSVRPSMKQVLPAEVEGSFVAGYAIPEEYRVHFREVPLPDRDRLVVRYHDGTLYWMDNSNYEIVETHPLVVTVE